MDIVFCGRKKYIDPLIICEVLFERIHNACDQALSIINCSKYETLEEVETEKLKNGFLSIIRTNGQDAHKWQWIHEISLKNIY